MKNACRRSTSNIPLVDAAATEALIQMKALSEILPSPENDKLYRPVDPNDPDIRALAESIRSIGVIDPLVVTEDGWILSGHRRYVAAQLAGLEVVPCRIRPVRRYDNQDEFTRLLREYNRQRIKSLDEQLREEAISIDPDQAYQALIQARIEKSGMPDFDTLATVEMGDRGARAVITDAKRPMLGAAQLIIAQRRAFWPLTVRQVHYGLLNDPPLKHASKPDSRYQNDQLSYDNLTDLLARARLAGLISWNAISDETRPIVLWNAYANPQAFIKEHIDRLFRGYWRNYQHSQPNHIELVAEKLTVRGVVEPVAQEYCLPLTIGRGYSSLPPRREIAMRFRASGKEKLVLLLLTDFDPDGENIAESFARSLRDDFRIWDIAPAKVALTADQVRMLNLPPRMKAKKGSSTYAQFTERHGDDVFELEAVAPEELQRILRAAIDSVLDPEMFNAEVAREREEAAYLESLRKTVHQTLAQVAAASDRESDR